MTTPNIIVNQAATLLQDEGVRWSAKELVGWYNAFELDLHVRRPDAFSALVVLTLVAGVHQTLPATYAKLLDILHTATGRMTPVRQVSRRLLDDLSPTWRAAAQSDQIAQYTYDPREPQSFEVSPPAKAGATVFARVAKYPTPVAIPVSDDPATVTGTMSAPARFANAAVDYIMYRAYSKDSEYTTNSVRAEKHLASYLEQVGADMAATALSSPKVGAPGEVKA